MRAQNRRDYDQESNNAHLDDTRATIRLYDGEAITKREAAFRKLCHECGIDAIESVRAELGITRKELGRLTPPQRDDMTRGLERWREDAAEAAYRDAADPERAHRVGSEFFATILAGLKINRPSAEALDRPGEVYWHCAEDGAGFAG
jgi:hypothetical protein